MKRIVGMVFFYIEGRKIIERRYFSGGIGFMMCNYFYKYFIPCHKGDFLLHFTSCFNHSENLIIPPGKDSLNIYISFNYSNACYYQALNGIEMGEGTLWAAGCSLISANYSYTDITQNEPAPPIKIGKYVWIGTHSVILPGVELGHFCIVGAGSVDTKSFGSHFVLAGVPAKPIGKRCKQCLQKISLDQNLCSGCKPDI